MSNGTIPWHQGLVGSARQIAATEDTPLRVLAGPGTGKTFALMRRVMRVLQSGADALNIFVCTFTRTAARDLETELQRLGTPGADEVKTGTVHSFCFSVLSRAEVLRLTGRNPRPLLGFEERFLLEDLRGTNGEGIRDLGKRLNAFAAAWARLQTDTPGWPHDPADRTFLQALESWLIFHQAMLVGELVPETLRFIRDNPASPHRPQFEYVMVDEYQDLNRAEQVLLDELSSVGALTLIGDEDQSIYSFKFANPEGIAHFDQSHPGTHDESLEECRRCPRLVVSIANSLIGNNRRRASRVLLPRVSNPEGEVLVVQWGSTAEEAEGLARLISDRISAARVSAGRVLVLAPRRQFGYAIRDALVGSSVPAHSFFYEEALDGNPTDSSDSKAQEAFALLTLLAKPNDQVALRCWCGFGSSSLNRNAWARVRQHCESTGELPWISLEALAAGTLKLPYTSPLIKRFEQLRNRLSALQTLQGRDLIDSLFPDGEDWAIPLRAIAEAFPDDGEPDRLVEIVQRGVTQPELPTDVDYVRVMSLHKSKGLTADLVIVAGCIEGLIPTLPRDVAPDETLRALEEQRRLFYVAITRATHTLVLSSVTQLPLADAHRMGAIVRFNGATITSRFVSELGPDRPAAVRGTTIL
jgi:DNA helicase-2/ATP-dependent DNA helicase PcrA